MAVLQMQKISICAMKEDRKALLEKLQSMGVVEIHALQDSDGFCKTDTASAKNSFERASASIDRAVEILDLRAPEKKSFLSFLEGKEPVSREACFKASVRKDSLMKTVSRIQSLEKEMSELRGTISKLEGDVEALLPWLSLDIPMNEKGTENTSVIIGSLPGEVSSDEINAALSEFFGADNSGNSDNSENSKNTESKKRGADVEIISSGKEMTCIVVICLKTDAEALEDSLRAVGFTRAAMSFASTPAEETRRMRAEIEENKKQIEKITDEMKALCRERRDLKLLSDYYRIRADKYAVLGTLIQSEWVFIVNGYIPKKYSAAVEKSLEKSFDCIVDIEEPGADEEVPVALENNSFASSAEGILESYGLPKKGEVDPTSIMSVFYVILFGIMLSDAAYGAIVSAVCGALLLKFRRMSEGMRRSLKLFFLCGLSTLFWGVMFGGYFGDALNVISRTFFGREIEIPALWFVPLKDPMKLLIYSMLFGLIHLFVGLGIKGYMCIKDKRYLDFFCDVVLWYMLVAGLILMFLPTSIFSSIANIEIVFPTAVNIAAKVMAALGAVGILLMSGRRKKNFGVRIALGAYDLYNATGWLSDLLSYSRLLALGLATGVIAQVINQMGSMMGKSVPGVIFFIVVFILGHALNLAINLLGAYVHTNRLQYVEFFGKFYEGGGRPFAPFKENTKYADIADTADIKEEK